ncbi:MULTISPECIES: low specificity L-threonine aldolase [unclassified Azospirillum]|uniref:threonine aldolase family protein n=1 Tax=unclassified Azospirillum TaxID=2630922 RepID=UPI000B75E1D1|nr:MULTISPECIES: low specificity L-threonine aldolase [unclassified Azospirillum]SNS39737.1 L-threonine aldolase [Azospirillum sp. RU38E]SNS58138.1 L-threonine aldolase [Azospirillum sp. RU37A]
MNFMSDNVAGAAPEIMAALLQANGGTAPSYGADAITKRLEQRFADLFGRAVAVFPVATGTAANALALAQFTPAWGAIYCHAEAHIQADECGAPEMFSGGAKLVPLPGPHGKLSPDTLAAALDRAPKGFVHAVQPAALSLTQATEAGTVYCPDEVAALAEIAHRHGLSVHMDGARFANAVAHLGCDPAEVTWRAGVDALSFGATKNGALGAEAVIFFDPAKAADFAYRRKRSAHLFSKMRFLSAQLDAYLADGLWLRLAAHANAMAARLAQGLAALPGVTLAHPVEANEIFAALPEAMITHLQTHGAGFYRWDGQVVRLVTAWNTPAADVEHFLALAAAAAEK